MKSEFKSHWAALFKFLSVHTCTFGLIPFSISIWQTSAFPPRAAQCRAVWPSTSTRSTCAEPIICYISGSVQSFNWHTDIKCTHLWWVWVWHLSVPSRRRETAACVSSCPVSRPSLPSPAATSLCSHGLTEKPHGVLCQHIHKCVKNIKKRSFFKLNNSHLHCSFSSGLSLLSPIWDVATAWAMAG